MASKSATAINPPPVTNSERWRAVIGMERWLSTPMALLSAVWLVIAVMDLTGNSNPLLDTIAIVIWVIFIADYLIRLVIAPDKSRFFKRNVLTLVALVVPALRLLRAFAAFRALSLVRGASVVRVVGVINRSMYALKRTLRRHAFHYVVALTMVVALVGAAGMYFLEPASQVPGGFESYWDALWWTAMLLTSIGSQYWPQSQEARVLTILLSIYGLAILGYLTATIASFFIGRDAADPGSEVASSKDIAGLRREIAALRSMLAHPPANTNRGD